MPSRQPLTVLIAFLTGCALVYLMPFGLALEAVLAQRLYKLQAVQASPVLSWLALHLASLALSTLGLAYLLARVAFSPSLQPRPVHVVAFLLPLPLQALSVALAIGAESWSDALEMIVGLPQQLLIWLALALVALLAFVQARRPRGAV